MKIYDSLLGLLFAALGFAVLVTVSGYPRMPGQDVGPALFPGAVGGLMIAFGAILAVRARRIATGRPQFALGEWSTSPRHVLAGLAVILGCLVYALASSTLGFLIVTPPLLFVWHLAFGVRPKTAIASALLTTLATFLVFYKGLGVPLPWGLLKSYAF